MISCIARASLYGAILPLHSGVSLRVFTERGSRGSVRKPEGIKRSPPAIFSERAWSKPWEPDIRIVEVGGSSPLTSTIHLVGSLFAGSGPPLVGGPSAAPNRIPRGYPRTCVPLLSWRGRSGRAGLWELRGEQVVIPIPGKRKQFLRPRGSARAADQRLRDLIDQQAPSRSDGVGVTFGQLLDQWLEKCD